MWIVIAIGAAVAVIAVIFWFYFRQVKILVPFEVAETEAFREKLDDVPGTMIWGRDDDGQYYAIVWGAEAARTLRRLIAEHSSGIAEQS